MRKKIFVTVGTTSFDSLVKAMDNIAYKNEEYDFVFQKASGSYLPVNGHYFEFTDSINHFYEQSSVIVTHAGAGTIYKLLELRKKIIIFPNLDRIDKHQSDIANFMDKNGHVLVAWTKKELEDAIYYCSEFNPIPYVKNEFFKFKEIADFIESK